MMVMASGPVNAAEPAPTAEQLAFFEKNIRPVLVRECYSCHAATAKKIRGGLVLDTRDGARKGGERGNAVVPGDLKASLLVKAIRHTDKELQMPPKQKLGEQEIADLEKWIAMGAPDPRDGNARTTKQEIDIEKGRTFWSFQPPKRATAPDVKDAAWPRSEIDRFLLAGMEAKGLKPVADADPRTLLRRLTFDLTGLPPTPEELYDFVRDHATKGPLAVEKAVDRLLASPRFGERWGRHWLDVARFAESSGRSANIAYPHAWRYRDYVIAAFNQDKPYDQFVREQLAGDLLPSNDDREKAERLVATGFLAIGPKTHDERNRRQFAADLADEQIDATFQAFQGLTVACARCHDHKFDPIPQKDYYALSGIFRSTETCYGTIRLLQSNHPSALLSLPKDGGMVTPLEPLTGERRAEIDKQIQSVRDEASKITGQNAFIRRILLNSRAATLRSQLDLYEADGTPKYLAMGVREGRTAQDDRVLNRGEVSQPGETVKRGLPRVLTRVQPDIGKGSGRRELADWIAAKENPLTARVMANRVWLHLLGRGLVPTPDNFGASGLPPSNQALLDHLALSFADNGWSVKNLIRTIVLSRTYQLSGHLEERNFEADPDNVLAWRMPPRRLEAEALRDSMLAISGRLELAPPKGSSVQRGGEGNAGFRFRGPGAAAGNDDRLRTVYLSVVRDGLPESLTLFDFPDPSLIVGERSTTTVPAQALYLLNNPFVLRQAEALADRLLALEGEDPVRIERGFVLCCSRPPSEKERKTAEKFLEGYASKQSRRAAWTAFAQALFASGEFSQH
ncbi:hypothetical protein AYO40_05420 [Planctomycetaceae bacterium SCGC AG-212-D15]|nr:hypothetical protein AYO40_05420 [Planctomycetaceae bacterium SCGC AG-212-D15]